MSGAFRMTVRCPRGTVLVGGYSSVPEELDAVHARRLDGKAILPSSALRGALREGLEALLRGVGRPACAGGDGVDPAGGATSSSGACTLDGGEPCVACRLFGSQRTAIGPNERAFSALVLQDAVASGDFGTGIRHGVSIHRRRRSARDGLLFNREVPLAGQGERQPTFVAEGRLLDDELRKYLEAATRVTAHLGSGRSRGLGRVDISIDWGEPVAVGLPSVSADGVDVELRFETAGCVGTPFSWRNLRTTRREIPGAALRGAVGFALAEVVEDLEDEAFQGLVDEAAGAIFDFAWPTAPGHAGLAGPWPLTARGCKRKASHPASDVLIDRLVLTLAGPEAEGRVAEHLERDPKRQQCATCGGALKARKGWRGTVEGPKTRVTTRLALDRRTGSAKTGALFSTEMLERDSTFTASIRRVPQGSETRLAQALAHALSVGAGRHRGWGRVTVDVRARRDKNDFDIRARRFKQALAEAARSAGIALDAERYIPVTLLAPLLPVGDDDGRHVLAQALGLQPEACVLRVRRFGEENGWDQRKGRRAMVRSVVAGSVFVFDVGPGRNVNAIKKQADDLERDGAGQRRTQGFGRVILFDPALVEPPGVSGSEEMKSDEVWTHRKALVTAAEKVMDDYFARKLGGFNHDRPSLGKSQLSQLVGVCNEAACAEEIINYLRYQVGRQNAVWSHGLLKALVDGMGPVASQLADDATRVQAWQRFATYLSRAFTYHNEAGRSEARK